MNRKALMENIERNGLTKLVSPEQEFSINTILDEALAQGISNLHQIAYILGTVKWETAHTMLPVAEYGKGKGRKYGGKVRINGKPYIGSNIYYGRGYVQSTWIDNYEKLTTIANKQGYAWDFVKQPDLLLQVKPSAWAAVYGMKHGIYTGKKLSDYFHDNPIPLPAGVTLAQGTTKQYVLARKIINGTDKAEQIAEIAERFFKALSAS